MKKILNKIGQVLQVVLLAPIKLPGRTVNILKYIAVGLGVLETVLDKEVTSQPAESADETLRGAGPEGAPSAGQQPDPPAKELSDAGQGSETTDTRTGERSEVNETE